MTSDRDPHALEDRVRTHLQQRAAGITADTLRPAQPPVPPPGAARRFPGWRRPVLRLAVPLAVGASTALAVLAWAVLAPDPGTTTDPVPVPPAGSARARRGPGRRLPRPRPRPRRLPCPKGRAGCRRPPLCPRPCPPPRPLRPPSRHRRTRRPRRHRRRTSPRRRRPRGRPRPGPRRSPCRLPPRHPHRARGRSPRPYEPDAHHTALDDTALDAQV